MKKLPLSPRFIIFLAFLLFIIILAQSLLEYRSGNKAVHDLLNNQARALILSVARAGEKGLIAYEIQQEKIQEHLFTIAEMIDRLDRAGQLNMDELKGILSSNGLLLLQVVDIAGNRLYLGPSDATTIQSIDISLLAPIMNGKTSKLPLEFTRLISGNYTYAVAIRRTKGGAVAVGIDTSELLILRRTFGAGSVIDDISESPGVEYAGILQNGALLAASRRFPKASLDNWYEIQGSKKDSIITRINKIETAPGREVLEAIGPFTVGGEYYGNIVIGMDTGYLELLSTKLKRDIIWRSVLFLIVAVIAVVGATLRQNYRLLSSKYSEIKGEVQNLEADKALSAKLVAMGELAGGVAHEIRNPLNAIRVIIQRLEREFKPQNNEAEYKEFTAIIRKETDKINDSIKHFLALAKPPVLHKSPVNLNDCVRDILALFQPRAQAKGCTLKSTLGNLPLMNLDCELIQQAVLNLLENSLSAVDSSGLIEIKSYQKENKCYLEFADNGPGIPNEEKSRVFDIYYTTKPTGTGMGLPTVLRIIKEHGGRIELLDSSIGGALFRLEFSIE